MRVRDWTPPEAPPTLFLRGVKVRVIGHLGDGRVRVEMWGGIGEAVVYPSEVRDAPYCPPHTPGAGSKCTTCGARLWAF